MNKPVIILALVGMLSCASHNSTPVVVETVTEPHTTPVLSMNLTFCDNVHDQGHCFVLHSDGTLDLAGICDRRALWIALRVIAYQQEQMQQLRNDLDAERAKPMPTFPKRESGQL